MNKILILGSHSFVSKGLVSELDSLSYYVHEFSRGKKRRQDNKIYGNYLSISSNELFDNSYDIVINFAILKDQSLDDNIQFIKDLIDFCKSHGVKKLIHFSSIMVYNYALKDVTENTEIEHLDYTIKNGYGKIKIAVDQFLMENKDNLPFELIIVRPGYVLADNRPCPFIKRLPFGCFIIKGNMKSKQPVVRREDIHKALIRIIETEKNLPIYHFFPNDGMTKYRYAKQIENGTVLIMPKCIFKYIPFLLSKIGIIPKSLYSRFEGMYIESNFSSVMTENKLNIQFK